jgi:hypothetical protein
MQPLLDALSDIRLAVGMLHDANVRSTKAQDKILTAIDALAKKLNDISDDAWDRGVIDRHVEESNFSWWNNNRIAEDLKMQGGYEPVVADLPAAFPPMYRPTGFASHPFAWSPGPRTEGHYIAGDADA